MRAPDRPGEWGDTLVRWGGVALIAAGVLGLVASALFVVAALRAPKEALSYAYDSYFVAASLLQWFPRWALVCAGLAGFYFLLDRAPKPVRRMALTGASLASLALAFPLIFLLDQVSEDTYGTSSGPSLSEMFFLVPFSVAPAAGIVLCGVAAFWARGLGRRRSILLAVGVLDSPVLYWLVFVIVRNSIDRPFFPYSHTLWMQYSLQVPVVLTSVGWILVGRLLYGARDREAGIIATEQRMLARANRSKARRLYTAAWGTGDLTTVDDLVAEVVLDHEHGRSGRQEFKKTVVDLHRTFSDLTLSIEEQTAQYDKVTTRCVLSGTDRGGVLWYPPTGKHATFTATYTDRFSDGRLVEHEGEIDMAALLKQLGIPAGV